VPGGNLGFLRQVQLGQAPVLAPMAQVLAKRAWAQVDVQVGSRCS
jgi:hypothetical protein